VCWGRLITGHSMAPQGCSLGPVGVWQGGGEGGSCPPSPAFSLMLHLSTGEHTLRCPPVHGLLLPGQTCRKSLCPVSSQASHTRPAVGPGAGHRCTWVSYPRGAAQDAPTQARGHRRARAGHYPRTSTASPPALPSGRAPPSPAARALARGRLQPLPGPDTVPWSERAPSPPRSPEGEHGSLAPLCPPSPGARSGRSPAGPHTPEVGGWPPRNPDPDSARPGAAPGQGVPALTPPRFAAPPARAGFTCSAR
jgi:hypothetical protein